MHNCWNLRIVALLIGLLPASVARAASDDFSTNPLAGGSAWSFGVGSNVNNQFTWTPGSLKVRVDSSLPTARLDLPIGQTLTDSSSFLLSARFSFQIISAPANQASQISFGLTNHTLTGGDRTGTLGNFFSDNTYNTVEVNYFPNVSVFNNQTNGPTLSPAIFGSQTGVHAFDNFQSVFGPGSDLSDNTIGVKELPQSTPLEAQLAYDGATKTAVLSMFTIGAGNTLVPLNAELVPLDLLAFGSGYDPAHPFAVNSLSIMAYFDGFTTPNDPSLVADVVFDSISVAVPEPGTLVLLGMAAVALVPLARRRRQRRAAATPSVAS